MKRGDLVRVTTGDHAGEIGQIIRVFRGWVDFVRADSKGVQVRAGECERVEDDEVGPGPEVFAREHMNKWAEAA